jgi:hypothetical protein
MLNFDFSHPVDPKDGLVDDYTVVTRPKDPGTMLDKLSEDAYVDR